MRIAAQLRAGHEEDPVHAAPAAAGESTEEEARQAGCSPPRPVSSLSTPSLIHIFPGRENPRPHHAQHPPLLPLLLPFRPSSCSWVLTAQALVRPSSCSTQRTHRPVASAPAPPPRTRSSDPRHHLPASQAPRLPASRYGARTAASMSQKRFVQGLLTPTDIAAARATEAAAPRRSSFLPTRATSRIPPRVTTAESGMLTGGRE